jgi:TonB family protein
MACFLAPSRAPAVSSLFFGLLVLAGFTANAQSMVPDCITDPKEHTDSLSVYLSLSPAEPVDSLVQQSYEVVGLAIFSAFTQPQRITAPSWPGTYFRVGPNAVGTPLHSWFGLGGYVTVELDRSGRFKQDRTHIASGSPEITSALRLAVTGAEAGPRLPAFERQAYPRDGVFRFELEESLVPIPHAIALARAGLLALRIDRWPQVERVSYPKYPLEAQQKRVEGRATFQFVIDASGVPIQDSFTLLEADYREFAEAAFSALQKTTYRPAFIGDCPVPSLVVQSVTFKVK